MNTILLLVYSLLSERVTGSGGGRGKSPKGFVTSDSLPAGTYKAVEQNGTICPELPRLVSFEMVVTNGEEGQLASFNAEVLSIESSAIRDSIGGSEKAALVWYSYDNVRTLRQFGSLRVGLSPNCFHVEPKGAAYNFIFHFYRRLGLVTPSRIASQLIFCLTEFGIIVGIGRKFDTKNGGRWKSTTYGFRIALSEGSRGDRADDVPEKSRKRSSHFQAGGGPRKLAKREEGSDASHGSSKSSYESPGSGMPLPEGGYLRRSDDETGGGGSTFEMSVHLQPGVAFRAGTEIEEWEGEHGGPYYGEAANRVFPPIIPDDEYETLDTGLDNVWKITVNVRTDTETHQRWVGLRVDLCAYEWPVYFPQVTADSHEDCLYLNYSGEEHSADLPLLEASLLPQQWSLEYVRICRATGGGWWLRLNKTFSSVDTDGESATPSTIDIKLHAVLPS